MPVELPRKANGGAVPFCCRNCYKLLVMAAPSNAATRPTRSPDELAEAAGTVGYELQQLALGVAMLPCLEMLNTYFNNAAIEAFLVHYRSLRDFLYPRSSTKYPVQSKRGPDKIALDTAIAYDFDQMWGCEFKDWESPIQDDAAQPISRKLEADAINKCLQHVSYTRLSLKRNWPRPEMCHAILQRFGTFLCKLPAERREWFASRADIRSLFPGLF